MEFAGLGQIWGPRLLSGVTQESPTSGSQHTPKQQPWLTLAPHPHPLPYWSSVPLHHTLASDRGRPPTLEDAWSTLKHLSLASLPQHAAPLAVR